MFSHCILSIVFTLSIWIITTDHIIQGTLILISVVFGVITGIALDIMSELRKSKILKLWSEAIISLWVVLPPASMIVVVFHDFPLLIFWILLSIGGIYVLYYIGNGIKRETQNKTKEYKNEYTKLNNNIE